SKTRGFQHRPAATRGKARGVKTNDASRRGHTGRAKSFDRGVMPRGSRHRRPPEPGGGEVPSRVPGQWGGGPPRQRGNGPPPGGAGASSGGGGPAPGPSRVGRTASGPASGRASSPR